MSLPELPKIATTIIVVVLAIVTGVAGATFTYKVQNPEKSINIDPFKFGSNAPEPSPAVSSSPSLIIQITPSPAPVTTPTVSAPAGWETYTNEILGFKISYPPTAALSEGDLRDEEIKTTNINPATYTYQVSILPTESELIHISSSVGVEVQYLPLNPQQTALDVKDASPLTLDFTTVSFAGKTAYQLDSTNENILIRSIFSLGKDENSELVITVTANKSSESIINQILNTFQFLN